MKVFFVTSIIISFLIPSFVFAQKEDKGTTTPQMSKYLACKKSAQTKKEKLLNDFRRSYVEESNTITNEAKISLEIVKWRVRSSFRAESRKILDEQKSKLDALADKTARMKRGVEETWKAEDALCTFTYEREQKAKPVTR